jgi:hypothetical protein
MGVTTLAWAGRAFSETDHKLQPADALLTCV